MSINKKNPKLYRTQLKYLQAHKPLRDGKIKGLVCVDCRYLLINTTKRCKSQFKKKSKHAI